MSASPLRDDLRAALRSYLKRGAQEVLATNREIPSWAGRLGICVCAREGRGPEDLGILQA